MRWPNPTDTRLARPHLLPRAAVCLGLAIALLLEFGASLAAAQQSPGNRRIVGGELTRIERHPWQVALNIDGPNGIVYLCGGSLIAQHWVLTAAHCFHPQNTASDIRAKVGASNYLRSGSWLPIDQVIVHEAYDGKTYAHDIALVRLRTAQQGRSIPMAGASLSLVGERLEVTGWGATSEMGRTSSELRLARVPFVDTDTCNSSGSYNGAIGTGMLCAGEAEGGIDSCQGDSGGPLVLRKPGGPVLVGVVSFGEGCAQKLKYGVYTRVSAYRDWTDKALAGNN
jgi:trypsin